MEAIKIAVLDHHDYSVAEEIHAIQMVSYMQEARLLGVQSFPPLQRTIADLEITTDRYLGAHVGSVLAGALGLEENGNDVRIASLVVHPRFQRRGIGRALVLSAISEAGSRTLLVSTGLLNRPALALYLQLGFVEVQRSLLEKDSLAMVELRRSML